jgi:hypothetical protein
MPPITSPLPLDDPPEDEPVPGPPEDIEEPLLLLVLPLLDWSEEGNPPPLPLLQAMSAVAIAAIFQVVLSIDSVSAAGLPSGHPDLPLLPARDVPHQSSGAIARLATM